MSTRLYCRKCIVSHKHYLYFLCDKTEIVYWRKFKSTVLSKLEQNRKTPQAIYFFTVCSTTYFIFSGENISTVSIKFACFSDLFCETFVWACLSATDCLICIFFFWNTTETANKALWVARLPSLLWLWYSGLLWGERSCIWMKRSLFRSSGLRG